MAKVVLERVTKVYGKDVIAVRELDLHIRDGELMVLVGPSGCGKSTTLRMVAGLEEITSGTMRIGDRVVNDVPPKDRDIAMVFQSYALYPHMTVRGNMAFGLEIRRMPKAEVAERVGRAAETLGIGDLLDRKPKALSGGQRQRVAMGRALVRQPSVFLFDEPLSNLDARLRVQMRVEIARLHQELRTTMVYVTHDQVEAMTLATRISVMSDGLLQQVGTPMEVYHQPANRFVAGFIGSPGMNFIDGRLEGSGPAGALMFVGPGVRVALTGPQRAAVAAEDLSAGEALTLGVRPQGMDPLGNGDGVIEGRALVVERLGAETFVHMTTEGAALVARLDGDVSVQAGEALRMGVDAAAMHLFAADGRNLFAGCIEIGGTAHAAPS